MLNHRGKSVMTFFLSVMLMGALGAASQSVRDRVTDLEDRVLRLEATVEAMAEDGGASDDVAGLHTVTGFYIERPEAIAGTSCVNFYPEGTTVILTDAQDNVLDTSELGPGELLSDGRCGQSFTFDDIPESPLYTFYVERQAVGSAYALTLEQMEENDWHIGIVSRYRP